MLIFYHANKNLKSKAIICSIRLFNNMVISFLKTGSKHFYKGVRHSKSNLTFLVNVP